MKILIDINATKYCEEQRKKEQENDSRRCFMGDCERLYSKDDPCKDHEAQSGRWGKCKEFEPKKKERAGRIIMNSEERHNDADWLEFYVRKFIEENLNIKGWKLKKRMSWFGKKKTTLAFYITKSYEGGSDDKE